MKKRILGGLLAFLLLGSTIVCAVAAEPVPTPACI